jgi:hypothetical protein
MSETDTLIMERELDNALVTAARLIPTHDLLADAQQSATWSSLASVDTYQPPSLEPLSSIETTASDSNRSEVSHKPRRRRKPEHQTKDPGDPRKICNCWMAFRSKDLTYARWWC